MPEVNSQPRRQSLGVVDLRVSSRRWKRVDHLDNLKPVLLRRSNTGTIIHNRCEPTTYFLSKSRTKSAGSFIGIRSAVHFSFCKQLVRLKLRGESEIDDSCEKEKAPIVWPSSGDRTFTTPAGEGVEIGIVVVNSCRGNTKTPDVYRRS